MTLGFLFGSKNFCKLLCVSWEVFCFARIRLDPLSGQVLHHDCISMIVSRFTLFTKNFMVCCYQVTELFRSRHDCTSEFSARSSCYFGSQADVAISVLREVNLYIYIYIYIYIVLARYNFSSRLWSWLTKEIAGASLYSGTLSSTRFFVYFSNHSGRSRNGFPPYSFIVFIFIWIWDFCWSTRRISPYSFDATRILTSLSLAGCCVGTMGSCGTNVGEVSEDEVEELVDRPGTTKGT